jgi:MoxR-like ATPase
MDAVSRLAEHVRTEMSRVIVGQHDLKTQCLVVLLCQGHALLEGVPGIAKTLTVKTLSRLLGLDFHRVQATSDLMPADILGTNVLAPDGQFRLHKGPAFTELLLVDEINRMPPRTQGALLECMEERQVTIDGVVHALSPHFTVFATQNPIEFEGTYPLPEAQLDRFLAKIRIDYPSADDEVRLLANTQQGFDARRLGEVQLEPIDASALVEAIQTVQAVKVQESLLEYIVRLVARTREWPAVTLGGSPRATINLMRFAKVLAALDARDYVLPDDVKAAVPPVLRHRLIVKPEADLEGVTTDQILHEVIRAVDVPK